MTAKRTDMHQIQELNRLHRLGTRVRALSRSLSMGREKIRTYFATLREAGLRDGPVDALPEMDARASLRASMVVPSTPTLTMLVG